MKLAPIFNKTKNCHNIRSSKACIPPKAKVTRNNIDKNRINDCEKERQSLSAYMRKFLLDTTVINRVSTNSASKTEILGETTVRDGADTPAEKAEIAAPIQHSNEITYRSKIRLGVKGKVTNQK